jgi:hypothetical protein
MGSKAYSSIGEYDAVPAMHSTVKKPSFIKRWFYNIAKEAWNYEQAANSSKVAVNRLERDLNLVQLSTGRSELDAIPLNLKVYSANGGTIVEATRYDRKKDSSSNQLHIITHDQNLGEGLAKIITMEALRG